MTRIEDDLCSSHVLEQLYPLTKTHPSSKACTYQERLRASFNKLLVPDWFNHDYTSAVGNGLRKTKSHGHVPRVKPTNDNNNNNNNSHHDDDTPDTSVSSSTASPHLSSNETHRPSNRHRSPSRSWSERAPRRRDSAASSYDANGSALNGRRSTLSNGTSNYAPGVQRVAQSSTWYKPRTFPVKTINGHLIAPPKPLPRYSKMEQERAHSTHAAASFSPSKPALIGTSPVIQHVRCSLKSRTMAQAQLSSPREDEADNEALLDATLVNQSSISHASETTTTINIGQIPPMSSILRSNSSKSLCSDAESYCSAVLPPTDKNLLDTDSSSYASVDDRCLSPSTASYHTALAGDTSSMTGYETPTPQSDDDGEQGTLSSHSSLSDLSHAETLEPNTDDLDSFIITPAEPNHLGAQPMLSNADLSSTASSSRPTDNAHWYDGSMETCIQHDPSELREIPNDENLREIDINAVGDEFFLFSPRHTMDDEQSDSLITEHDEHLTDSPESGKRVFTMDSQTSRAFDDFHCSSSEDPFGFDQHHSSSIMITNLDDIIVDDGQDNSIDRFLHRNYRRPIQEDVLYEVEHENSFSDHSQNTSSIVPTDDPAISINVESSTDFLTDVDNPIITDGPLFPSPKRPMGSKPTVSTNETSILPIYMIPPLYTTTPYRDSPSPTLHIDTEEHFQKWDTMVRQWPDLTSPSLYTSKIRHRHYSVGSYYDYKTTTVALHSNHTLYLLGSAPVSPLSRASTASSDSFYQQQQHPTPICYDAISLNALRRAHPFLDSRIHSSSSSIANYDHSRTIDDRASTFSRENTDSTSMKSVSPKRALKRPATTATATVPTRPNEPLPIVPQAIASPPPTRTSSVTFSQYAIPMARTRPTRQTSFSPSPPPPPPRPALFKNEASLARGRTPPTFPRTIHHEHDQPNHIYQEIDRTLANKPRRVTPNADLQFIRGAIERVFEFHGGSTTSDSSGHYEELPDEQQLNVKKSSQYPAVEAIQRFYHHRMPIEQVTDLDDVLTNNSSISNRLYAQSPAITARTNNERSKSSDNERASSEEIDDTLNDIEEVEDHDEKLKRARINHPSSHTSHDNSPIHHPSTTTTAAAKRSSQETQTFERAKPLIVVRQSPSKSSGVHRTILPPIDIVTQMVIEQDEDEHDTLDQLDAGAGEMIVFYDDIEIVEHSTSSYSTESDSGSSSHISSRHYSKPTNTAIEPAPPIPARTLKPRHLINYQTSSSAMEKTRTPPKKVDVNSVNDMLNRTDFPIGPSSSHRHPSARHFVGKLNNDDLALTVTNGYHRTSTLPARSSSTVRPDETHRSVIADTDALVKHIQNSLTRNSLHDQHIPSNLSTSSKDLRTFVSSTYSPSGENAMDDNGRVHQRPLTDSSDDQTFKRQARLSKSFHNVSEYKTTDHYPHTDQNLPSKSVENNLNRVSQQPPKPVRIPARLPSVVNSTSSSALLDPEDNPRMLSMKWYTGHVSENSEIGLEPPNLNADDLLKGYIAAHSNRDTQVLLDRLRASTDARIHLALDDIRSRVAQFDTSKTRDDVQVFMRYLESRLRDLGSNTASSSSASLPKQQANGKKPQLDSLSIKSRTTSSSTTTGPSKDTPPSRQVGRQQLRSAGGNPSQQPVPPRRGSHSSATVENPTNIDEMLNTVLALPKKSVSGLPSLHSREKMAPSDMTTNPAAIYKPDRDIGKRLFESGTFKDPRLLYDGPARKEKVQQQPLETSV